MTKLKEDLSRTQEMELCSRHTVAHMHRERGREKARKKEGTNTKAKFYKLINSTVFTVSLKHVLLGCRDTVSMELL